MATYRGASRVFPLGGVAILLLVSCAVIPEYPSQLPPLVEADERLEHCPAIAGRYQDKGTVVSLDGKVLGHISLTQLLHGGGAPQPPADVFEIAGPQNDLVEIRSWRAGVQIASWRQPNVALQKTYTDALLGETYLCERGFVRLGRKYRVGADVAGVGISSDFLWLRRATDGSLIAHHKAGSGALIFLVLPVPAEKGVSLWYRFPPAQRSVEGPRRRE